MKQIYYRLTPMIAAGVLLFTKLPFSAVASEEELQENENSAVEIQLCNDQIQADADGISITDSTVTITKEGTYILSGTLDNGNVIIDAGKEDEIQLILNGVSIHAETFAPIYVKKAEKVLVILEEGTDNTLTNGGTFTQIDDHNVDAVIFSRDDITLDGTGSLTIDSGYGHGIVGKDEMVIAGGTYKITAGSDGIHADTKLCIDGGTFDIIAEEGIESTYIVINDGDITIEASDDGINAAQKSSEYSPLIEINGGMIKVAVGPGDTDGIDSNGDLVINGGTIDVSGNSAFDYDGTGVINGGTVIINGEQVTTLPNQMMGGFGGMDGHHGHGGPEGMNPPEGMNQPEGMNPPWEEGGFDRKRGPEFDETNSEQF